MSKKNEVVGMSQWWDMDKNEIQIGDTVEVWTGLPPKPDGRFIVVARVKGGSSNVDYGIVVGRERSMVAAFTKLVKTKE